MDEVILSALRWDPQIRGAVIVLAALLLLPGSVYLLLATNMGARLGLVLAIAGLSGWVGVMGVIWTVFGIGLKGKDPVWKVQEVLTGPLTESTVGAVDGFPEGWKLLKTGDAQLADAQAAADQVLAPSAEPAAAHGGGHGGGDAGAGEEEKFESPFKRTEDYVLLDGYKKGGETYFFTLRHRPHYMVVRVKPSFFDEIPPGVSAQADFTAPTTSVVMLRDLGNLRFPPFLVALCSFTIFGVCCYSLHQRDKEALRARTQGVT